MTKDLAVVLLGVEVLSEPRRIGFRFFGCELFVLIKGVGNEVLLQLNSILVFQAMRDAVLPIPQLLAVLRLC